MIALMYCRDRSTTGNMIVVPGRFERNRLESRYAGKSRLPSGTSIAPVHQLDLGLRGPREQGVGVEHRGAGLVGRQLAQVVGAGVVDHQEVGALGVVRAAGGAPDHVEVRLGHDRLWLRGSVNGRSGIVSPVHPVTAMSIASSRSVNGVRGSGRGPAQRAGLDRAAPADPVGTATPERADQRTPGQRVEPGWLRVCWAVIAGPRSSCLPTAGCAAP